MRDPLTTAEVAKYAKEAQQALRSFPLSTKPPRAQTDALQRAGAALNELLWLVDLVEAVDAGLVVIVDPGVERAA